jgi:hypothetical protein
LRCPLRKQKMLVDNVKSFSYARGGFDFFANLDKPGEWAFDLV